MKIYIRASASASTVFNTNDTKTSYYNNFLNPKDLQYMQKSKNRTGEIVMMTPDEYYEACSKIFKQSVNHLKDSRRYNSATIERYTQDMLDGDVFPLPYVNFADSQQEGLHRMMAAGDAFGWNKKFPVLVVTADDPELFEKQKQFDDMRDFERYDFKKAVQDASDTIADWDIPAPQDTLSQLKKAIIVQVKKDYGVNIDVDVECVDENGNIRINVYLTEYESVGEDERWVGNTIKLWMEDLFDMDESEFSPDDYY